MLPTYTAGKVIVMLMLIVQRALLLSLTCAVSSCICTHAAHSCIVSFSTANNCHFPLELVVRDV